MSGDVAISQSAPRGAAGPISATAAPSQGQDPVAAAVAASASSKRPLVNPSLHLDLALNLVVLQFVDDNGNVTSQIPSQKQLKAYQAQEAASAPGGQAAPAVKTAQAAPAGAVPGGSAQPGSGPSSTAPSDLVQTGVTQSYAAGVIKAPASTAQPVSAPVRPAGVDQSGD